MVLSSYSSSYYKGIKVRALASTLERSPREFYFSSVRFKTCLSYTVAVKILAEQNFS